MIDLLIANASVITVDAARHVYANGAIAIHHGKIVAVGPTDAVESTYQAETMLDATDMIAMPGLINCHMHLPQVIMRGVADDVDTMEVLKDYIWPIQGHYDQQDALISTKLGLLEMIKAGTTAFISTGLHPRYGIDDIAQAVVDSGMRAALSKYVMDIPAYALDEGAIHPGLWEREDDSMRAAEAMIERWHGAGDARLQAWYSPRSVGGCSPALLREVSRRAAEHGVGITAHWAEIPNNVEYTVKTYGMLPAEFAQSVGLLGPNVTFAHGICFEDPELALLARTGTSICHCPVTNAKLAMGTAKVLQMLQEGVNVCLGNDGMPVNNTADMFREMRAALLMHRNRWGDARHPTAAEVIQMATINGARALMADDVTGSLEAGKAADVILLDARKPHLYPLYDPVSAVAWAANGGDVDTVIIDGKIIMRARQVLTMDEDEILDQVRHRKDKIIQQAGVQINRAWRLN